jgi:hypothetical protein
MKEKEKKQKLATPYDGSYLSPLYLYPSADELKLEGGKAAERVPVIRHKCL